MCRGTREGVATRSSWNFLGRNVCSLDVNSMKPLDNLCHPVSVIKEAEELAAEAFPGRSRVFYGGRNNVLRAEHGVVGLSVPGIRSSCRAMYIRV